MPRELHCHQGCGHTVPLPELEGLPDDHIASYSCETARIQIAWEEGPTRTSIAASARRRGWRASKEHDQYGLALVHRDGRRLRLTRLLAPRTLLLAVTHHALEVLGEKDSRSWIAEVLHHGPAERELWARWQQDEVPRPGAVTEIATTLLADEVGPPGITDGFGWAVRCWEYHGEEVRAQAEALLAR